MCLALTLTPVSVFADAATHSPHAHTHAHHALQLNVCLPRIKPVIRALTLRRDEFPHRRRFRGKFAFAGKFAPHPKLNYRDAATEKQDAATQATKANGHA